MGTGVIKKEHLERTLVRLDQAQGVLLGLILNMVPTKGADAYATYASDYRPDLSATRTGERSKPTSVRR